jgi:hypothetical protein
MQSNCNNFRQSTGKDQKDIDYMADCIDSNGASYNVLRLDELAFKIPAYFPQDNYYYQKKHPDTEMQQVFLAAVSNCRKTFYKFLSLKPAKLLSAFG